MPPKLSSYDKAFFDETQFTSLRSAQEVVPLILDLLEVKNVIDIGCGTGAWLSVFEQFGVSRVLGIDNASLNGAKLQIKENQILKHDLLKTLELANDERFDLVTCLEVAEHLPASCAKQIVDNLTSLGSVVLFSAAIPHQGGTNHINEQWPEYWAKLFAEQGYRVVDCLRAKIWQNDNVAYWYAQNLLLYVKEDDLAKYPKLEPYVQSTDPNQLTLIHPKTYIKNHDRFNSPVVIVLRFVWGIVPRRLRLYLIKPLDSLIWKHVSTKFKV